MNSNNDLNFSITNSNPYFAGIPNIAFSSMSDFMGKNAFLLSPTLSERADREFKDPLRITKKEKLLETPPLFGTQLNYLKYVKPKNLAPTFEFSQFTEDVKSKLLGSNEKEQNKLLRSSEKEQTDLVLGLMPMNCKKGSRKTSSSFILQWQFSVSDYFYSANEIYIYLREMVSIRLGDKIKDMRVASQDNCCIAYFEFSDVIEFGHQVYLCLKNTTPKVTIAKNRSLDWLRLTNGWGDIKNSITECINYSDLLKNTKERSLKKKITTQLENSILLHSDLISLVSKGELELSKFNSFNANKKAYARQHKLQNVILSKTAFNYCLISPWTNIDLEEIPKAKCRHFWFWSVQPNRYKTTFLRYLSETYRCSWLNTSENFDDNIDPDAEILLIDEWDKKPARSAASLKKITDCSYDFKIKGMPSVYMKKLKLVVICSNYSLETCFKQHDVISLKARFMEFCVDELFSGPIINVDFFKRFIPSDALSLNED